VTRWVDATEHVVNAKDEIDAKWMKLFRAETGSTGEWFWLGQSLDRNKALIVRENETGALGQLAKTNKLWDNEGADTRGKRHTPVYLDGCAQTDILLFSLSFRATDSLGFLPQTSREICSAW
jgi:hypothetical protein